MLNCAVDWGRIPNNPIGSMRCTRVSRKRNVRPLPDSQIASYLGALDGTDRLLVSLIAYAGIRPSEALAIRWSDVGASRLTVDEATDGRGGIKDTKTHESRSVPLGPALLSLIREEYMRQGRPAPNELILGKAWSDATYRSWVRYVWRKVEPNLDVRPYDLRHTFVSRLIQEGHSVVEVARIAGHSPAVCLSTYAHLFDDVSVPHRDADAIGAGA